MCVRGIEFDSDLKKTFRWDFGVVVTKWYVFSILL